MKTCTQVREFLDTVLLYADSVAVAVGSSPPTASDGDGPDPQHDKPQQPSLLQLISRAAIEAESEKASSCVKKEADGGEPGEGGGDTERVAAVVSVFEVTPWGKFTPALNALVGFAARDGAELVMFQVRLTLPYCVRWCFRRWFWQAELFHVHLATLLAD